jgi:hypothetical protein
MAAFATNHDIDGTDRSFLYLTCSMVSSIAKTIFDTEQMVYFLAAGIF